MAFTSDRSQLLVGHDNSQLAYVYHLNKLSRLGPIFFPPGHYPRSIASSNRATLVASRVAGPVHTIDRVDLLSGSVDTPVTLGMYEKNVNMNTVLTASANGTFVLAAMPDGTVMLYDSSVDEFVASRQDFTALSGAYSASNYHSFAVDNHLLNASLVPLPNWTTQAAPPPASSSLTGRAIAPQPWTSSHPVSCSALTFSQRRL
jgi:hypothetical protein